MFNKERGITLVALVVTIVVLLILAGVALSLTLGNQGLVQKARETNGAYEAGAANDQAVLDNVTQSMNNLIEGGNP